MAKWLAAALLLAAAGSRTPAQWYVGGSAAYFDWSESSQSYPVVEHGMLVGFDAGYTLPAENGFLFAYRGRLYGGAAQYSGSGFFAPFDLASGATGYVGTMQEIQGRYRFGGQLDALFALGGNFWRRQMNAKQAEKYSVAYVAMGAEYNASSPGVTAGMRFNLPVWAQLDAGFGAMGFAQDPVLSLGRSLGGSATVGYRFQRRWALIAFADLFRFRQSPERIASIGGADVAGVFQPATSTYTIGLRAEFTR